VSQRRAPVLAPPRTADLRRAWALVFEHCKYRDFPWNYKIFLCGFLKVFFRVFQGGINVVIRVGADAPWRVPTTFDARRFGENDARRFDKKDARRFGEKKQHFVVVSKRVFNAVGTRHGASAPTRNTPRHVPRFASPNK
jgi:hypothetical protein